VDLECDRPGAGAAALDTDAPESTRGFLLNI